MATSRRATHEGQCPKCFRLLALKMDCETVVHHRTIHHKPCPGGEAVPGSIVKLSADTPSGVRNQQRVYYSKDQRAYMRAHTKMNLTAVKP